MITAQNLQSYFLKGQVLEAQAARKRLEAWLSENWDKVTHDCQHEELYSIATMLPEDGAV